MSINFNDYYKSTLQDNRYIFHYTNQSKAVDYILKDLQLKFSTRENCHDPFEQEDIVHTFSNETDKDVDSIRYIDKINEIRKTVKYACFSYDKDIIESYPWDKGCFRSRMWSQYANAHQGLCIVFNYIKIRDAALASMSGDPGTWIITDKVLYDNENNNLSKVCHLNPKEFDTEPVKRLEKYAKAYLFTKLKDYENEQEYRICIYDGKKTTDIKIDIKDAIEGIILGYKFQRIYLPDIQSVSKKLHFPITQVTWFRGIPSFTEID